MINWLKHLKLDFRIIGLLFMIWGFVILLEGLLELVGTVTADTNQSWLLIVRGTIPLIIGVYMYFRGDDVLIRQDK